MVNRSFLLRFSQSFNYYMLVLIAIGTPVLFSSYTRSVFEVNKLLLLRLCSILIAFFWLLKYRIEQDSRTSTPVIPSGSTSSSNSASADPVPDVETRTFLGIRYRPIGLELPIFIWIGLNILSTLFSQNIVIALIGAYDRWEGIYTVINYMFLFMAVPKFITTRRQLHGLIAAIIIPTVFSAIYGIFQSVDMDFMHWSVDPAARVFACINNPVHFCPYVSMVASLALGTLLYLSKKTSPSKGHRYMLEFTKWGLFLCLILIYFTTFLSYSRGTWMGLTLALPMVFMMLHKLLFSRSDTELSVDFFFTALSIFSLQLIVFLNIWTKGFWVTLPFGLLCVSYVGFSIYKTVGLTPFSRKDTIISLLFFPLLLFLSLAFLLPHSWWVILLLVGASVGLIILAIESPEYLKRLFARFVFISVFMLLQLVPTSLETFLVYLVLVGVIYLLLHHRHREFDSEQSFWLVSLMVVFALIIYIPGQFQSYRPAAVAQNRIRQYTPDISNVNPRVSMWKSAIVWIKDYWLLGTGPDTVKFMYPKYRRPEYGILEGGHNFTPDKLHNEYLNTMATRGVPATLVYYIGVMGGWVVLMLALTRRLTNGLQYIVMGILGSGTIYLVQIMFNFGVVATFVVFYLITGLGLAIRQIESNLNGSFNAPSSDSTAESTLSPSVLESPSRDTHG